MFPSYIKESGIRGWFHLRINLCSGVVGKGVGKCIGLACLLLKTKTSLLPAHACGQMQVHRRYYAVRLSSGAVDSNDNGDRPVLPILKRSIIGENIEIRLVELNWRCAGVKILHPAHFYMYHLLFPDVLFPRGGIHGHGIATTEKRHS